MTEARLVETTPSPRTRASLVEDLLSIGLRSGGLVIVHSSMSSIGWTAGGPVAVVQALIDVIGSDGTLVMPTHTAGNTDPAGWANPPVPIEWQQTIRESMPGFEPSIMPTRAMGAIAECFRTWPGTLRSYHPATSFAARGPLAEVVTAEHELDRSLGEGSPLARLYDRDGLVLLLGVDYGRNTSFHLAEYRVPGRRLVEQGGAVIKDGRQAWVTYAEVKYEAEHFAEIGEAFEATGAVSVGQVGSAESRLFPQRAAVDFAHDWFVQRDQR